MIRHFKPFCLLSCLVITACGGGGGSSSSSSETGGTETTDLVQISSSDILTQSLVNETKKVDLTAYVERSDGAEDFQLLDITQVSEDPSCKIESQSDTSFNVVSTDVSACDYTYTVRANDDSPSSESIARISFGETYSSSQLQPVSEVTDVNTPIDVDLSSTISSDSGFALSEDITVLGSGTAEVDVENSVVTYTPTGDDNDAGTTRILYSATDGTNVLLGTIDISVSTDIDNSAPVAKNATYPDVIDREQEITIDLSTLTADDGSTLISDPDSEDELQLVNVEDFNSSVRIVDINDLTNMQFTFETSIPGNHYVTYTISDHKGGYDNGIIKISVEVPDVDFDRDWDDITINDPSIDADITFTAPVTKAFVDFAHTDHAGSVTENGTDGPLGVDIATFEYEQAEEFCRNRGGRLPITRELNLLASIDGGVFETENWPTSEDFWTYDKTAKDKATTISLSTGANSSNSIYDPKYMTCVLLDSDAVDDFMFQYIKSEGTDNIYAYDLTTILLDPDGNEAPYQPVTFTSESNSGFGDDNTESSGTSYTDEQGIAIESYNFTVTDEDTITAYFADTVESLPQPISIPQVGFDVTDPDIWDYALLSGGGDDDLTIDTVTPQPLVGDDGAVAVPKGSGVTINGIAKQYIIGSNVDINFAIKRSNGSTLGQVNIILQQVSPQSPDVNDSCDPDDFGGECDWYDYSLSNSSAALTAGTPQNDERWIRFGFNATDNSSQSPRIVANYGGSDSDDIQAPDENGSLDISYYKISLKDGELQMFSSADGDDFGEALISIPLTDLKIDTDKFYWFGISGGTTNADIVRRVQGLDVVFN